MTETPPAGAGVGVLVVDDEDAIRNALARFLTKRGYDARTATNGEEALAHLKEGGISLMLLDVRMPGMSGTEFLAEAISSYPGAKRILLTAYADTQAAITSINSLGLDYYLLKPWDPPQSELYPVLEDLLSAWAAAKTTPKSAVARPRARAITRYRARGGDLETRKACIGRTVRMRFDARGISRRARVFPMALRGLGFEPLGGTG